MSYVKHIFRAAKDIRSNKLTKNQLGSNLYRSIKTKSWNCKNENSHCDAVRTKYLLLQSSHILNVVLLILTMYAFVKTIAAIPVGVLADARLKSAVIANGAQPRRASSS